MSSIGKLSCSLKHAREFKSIMATLQGILQSVVLHFTPDGLKVSTFDASNTFRITLIMPKNYFDHYVCVSKRYLHVDLKTMGLVLKSAKDDDSLKIISDNQDHVTFTHGARDKITTIKVTLLSNTKCILDENDQEICVNYRAEAVIPSEYFYRACTKIGDLSDNIELSISASGMHVRGKNEIITGHILLKANTQDGCIVKMTEDEPCKCSYQFAHLNKLKKLEPLGDVSLCVGEASPLKVRHEFGDACIVELFIAPTHDCP